MKNSPSRRPLSNEEEAESKKLKAIYNDRKASARAAGKKLTQAEVGEACGWESGQSAFNQYANGKVPLNIDALLKLADVLDFEPEEVSPRLAREIERIAEASPGHSSDSSNINVYPSSQPLTATRNYPIIKWEEVVGGWMEALENAEGTEWLGSYENAGDLGYWLEVRGDSMLPYFTNGMRILVQPRNFELISGKYYIALIRDPGRPQEATFKQYVRDAGVDYLRPLNSSYKIIEMSQHTEIIGRVIDFRPPESFL